MSSCLSLGPEPPFSTLFEAQTPSPVPTVVNLSHNQKKKKRERERKRQTPFLSCKPRLQGGQCSALTLQRASPITWSLQETRADFGENKQKAKSTYHRPLLMSKNTHQILRPLCYETADAGTLWVKEGELRFEIKQILPSESGEEIFFHTRKC